MNMRFSIITITFNAEKHLAETLSSVARQQFDDFEHILWDGGSKDRTLEIAREFPHVKIFQGQDEGISDAMNKGAAFAKGEYLLHLHADDLLATEKSLLFVDTCLRQHPGVKWLYGGCETIDCNGASIGENAPVPFCKKKLRKFNIISHPATFVLRDLFEEIGGFRKELSYCMDYDLWLRLSKKTEPFVLRKNISFFRKHENSLSTKLPLFVAKEAHLVRLQHTKNPWKKLQSYRTWKRRVKRIMNGF